MDVIQKNRYLWITVVSLVVLNLVLLALLWLGRPTRSGHMPPQKPERIRELLKEQLDFSDDQVQRYLELREQHHRHTQRLEAEIRDLKREMFSQVLDERAPIAVSDSLLSLVLEKQAELEKVTFQHFLDLKSLCGPGQKEKLKVLMGEVFRRNMPSMPKGKDGPPPAQQGEAPPPPPQ
jgi:hypothetical protein